MAIANALQLEAASCRASLMSCQSHVVPVVLVCVWLNVYCSCTQTAISQLPFKILRSPLNSLNKIS